jgi:hypothetical protein
MARHPNQFQPGQAKIPGSGMKPGTKTAKVKAREEAVELRKEALAQLFTKAEGKTTEEIIAMMNYNPLVHAITIATDPTTPVAIAQKANDTIMKKFYPDLKSVENKGEVFTAIRVIMPGHHLYDDHGLIQEETIVAGQLEQGMTLSELTDGLEIEDEVLLDDDDQS